MKRIFIFGAFLFFFSFGCNSFKSYIVTENLKFKRKFEKQNRSRRDLERQVKSRIYYLPEDVCKDTARLRTIANKIFMKNHRQYSVERLNDYKFEMLNDSIGRFNYEVRIIHGYDIMIYDKNKCTITSRKGYTGQF
jgi:hypothetical protein